MLTEIFAISGPLINRSLSAAIAIISASFFLYTLVKDIRNRVARTFSALLFFVMVTYVGDLGVSYADGIEAAVPWLRLQWVGIAFVPAVYVHLSDAILELTGLPSRGRRRRIVRFLYGIAVIFLGLVFFTEIVIRDVSSSPAPHFRTGPGFLVFLAYFIGSVVASFWFILRARSRTLTRSTRRRMNQLALTYAAPALAVFPFLLLSGQSLNNPILFYSVLIIVDTLLALSLSFMGYIMAFFGTDLPERLVKAQMMEFFLRGPIVAIAALAVILFVPSAGRVLRLPGEEVMPFLAVTTILFLQWAISLLTPLLERFLIYAGEDTGEIRQIQQIEERLLTGADFRQLLDTLLTGLCDYLRVESAFVASVKADGTHLEQTIRFDSDLPDGIFGGLQPDPAAFDEVEGIFIWNDYWLLPLYVEKSNGSDDDADMRLVGVLGVSAPEDLKPDPELEEVSVLMGLASRAAEVLEDRRIQSEVFASLEGLLPDTSALQRQSSQAGFGNLAALAAPGEAVLNSPDYVQKIKDALSHYWGGPQLTDDSLMSLQVVRDALAENDGNPQRAVRTVLEAAIENLRPEGQRSMTTAEWILYNILEMRFIQGRKVRDVALRLAMSEADFYRKQRVAIETVAELVAEMERSTQPEDEVTTPS